jgi:DNA-directed RNA polymerase subunit RPC12/RpoP
LNNDFYNNRRKENKKMTIPIIGGGRPTGHQMSDLENLPVVQCPICGEVRFVNVYVLRVLSALQSPMGQQQVIPQPQTFKCIKCGTVLGEAMKEEPDVSEDTDNIQTPETIDEYEDTFSSEVIDGEDNQPKLRLI